MIVIDDSGRDASIAAAVAEAMAASAKYQADARRFILEHGAQVNAGHALVGRPGDRGSDQDLSPDASDA